MGFSPFKIIDQNPSALAETYDILSTIERFTKALRDVPVSCEINILTKKKRLSQK